MLEENESELIRAHIPCSKCGSHDANAEYTDHYYCYSCGTRVPKDKTETITLLERRQIRMEEIAEGKIREIADRGITEETAKKFGVRTLVKDHKIARHFYPYYRNGEKVAEKVRICATKEFFWRGDSSNVGLFGHQCQPTTGRFVVICEGSVDTLTMWQVLGGRYTVVGLPNGCKNFKALKESYNYLDNFENIVLCLDGDKAGREATERAVQYLPQKKLKIMKLPEDLKDPNEFLKAGKTQELLNYFWRAEPYTPKDIVSIATMYDRIKDYRKTHQYVPTPWQGLNSLLQGTRPGQLVMLTSGSGQGKSLFMKTWMMHIVKTTDYRVGGIYLEESPEETVISLMSQVAGKNLKKNEVYDGCTTEELKQYFESVGANSRIDLFEPSSNTDPEYICNKIRYLAVARDCKYVFVDHISLIAEESSEITLTLNRLCKQLHDLCVELGLVIICACHTRKTAVGQKSAEDGGRISADDLKGSSSIKQLSDIVLALERNSQADDATEANTTLIRILKSRDFGLKGPATKIFYDTETTRLEEIGMEDSEEPLDNLLKE